VHRDVQRVVSLYATGSLKLDELVSATFDFESINDALAYCAAERGARAVVVL
jgi:Zn-dependent alcohol dehydrogenase